jgi:thioredoxin-related protein
MLRSAVVLPLLLLPLVAQETQELWLQDFAKAKAQAKAEKKDLLIDFTGSDWCGWCIKLDEEVFSKDEFKAAAPKSFILVKLDFPQDTSRVTPEIQEQNKKLGEQYGIQGYPTILLTDAEGVVYAQTGYEPGGPEKYLELLAGKHKQGAAFQTAMAGATGKTGIDRAKALDAALGCIDSDVVGSRHAALMEEIVKLDADGKAGLKVKFEGKLQELADEKAIEQEMQDLDQILSPLMEAQEPQKALAKLDEIAGAPKSKAQHQVALFFKGMVLVNATSDPAGAIKALEAAKPILPNSQIAKNIERILPQIQKRMEKEGGGK